MRGRQRELGRAGDSVIEGRDIGVVVVPEAELKIWLVADPSVRATRRQAERDGVEAAHLADELRRRDERDAANTHRATDAIEVDTTDLTPRRGRRPDRGPRRRSAMNAVDVTWALGRPTIGTAAAALSRLRIYGKERVPLDGGIVVASNHFSWLDPLVLGAREPARPLLHGEDRGAPRPGARDVDPRLRLLPRPTGRVRP